MLLKHGVRRIEDNSGCRYHGFIMIYKDINMSEEGKATISVYYAKSFYNAFITLEQINYNSPDNLLYIIPMVVNGAFSIEITLKSLLLKSKIEYNKEHNLINLYRMLPDLFQEEIISHLAEKAPEYCEIHKLSEELLMISNLFVDWRYAFEGNIAPAADLKFVSAFANAAILTMFSHYNVDLVECNDRGMADEHIEDIFLKNREETIKKNIAKIRWKQ